MCGLCDLYPIVQPCTYGPVVYFLLLPTLPHGDTMAVAYSYDADGAISEVGAMSISRYPNGKINTTTLGNTINSYTYNGFGDHTSCNVRYMGTDIFSIEYTNIDKLGRITGKTETFECFE